MSVPEFIHNSQTAIIIFEFVILQVLMLFALNKKMTLEVCGGLQQVIHTAQFVNQL